MIAELDMLASGFLAALRRTTRSLTKSSSQPSSTRAASVPSEEDTNQISSTAQPTSAAESPAMDSLNDAAASEDATAAANAVQPPDTTGSLQHTSADAAPAGRRRTVADGNGGGEKAGSGGATTSSGGGLEAAEASQPKVDQHEERSDDVVEDEVSHPEVEPGMDRSDVVDAQTFGRRLVEGLKADGQTAVGWVLQTFPKLLPFVMLSALRLDDDDYEEGEAD